MSMLVSFVLSFFPRDVLDGILNLIGSVSEGFPSYSYSKSGGIMRNMVIDDSLFINLSATQFLLLSISVVQLGVVGWCDGAG